MKQMKQSIKKELIEHIKYTLNQYKHDATDFEELHFHAFNEDYYIIGEYEAKKWFEKHGVDAFDALKEVFQWEIEMIGKINTNIEDLSKKKLVHRYVHILGEEILEELDIVDMGNTTQKDIISELDKL